MAEQIIKKKNLRKNQSKKPRKKRKRKSKNLKRQRNQRVKGQGSRVELRKKKRKSTGKVMNKALQIHKLKQFLAKQGIEADLVDLEALVDSTLTYRENKENVLKALGITTKKKEAKTEEEFKEEEIRDAIKQAQYYHEQRSKKAKALDENRKAKIPKNPEAWFRHPERYDLPQVDLPDGMSTEEYIQYVRQGRKK